MTLEKVNIENKKVNIEEDFTAKTASHVRKLQEALGKEIVFGSNRVEWMGNRGYFDLFPQSEVLRRLKKALCFPAEDISIFRDPKNGDVRNKTRYSRHIKTVMFLQRSGNH